MKGKKSNSKARARRVISDYDAVDTANMIDQSRQLKLEDLELKLPAVPPTQVISIRLPSALLNEIKAVSSETDVPNCFSPSPSPDLKRNLQREAVPMDRQPVPGFHILPRALRTLSGVMGKSMIHLPMAL